MPRPSVLRFLGPSAVHVGLRSRSPLAATNFFLFAGLLLTRPSHTDPQACGALELLSRFVPAAFVRLVSNATHRAICGASNVPPPTPCAKPATPADAKCTAPSLFFSHASAFLLPGHRFTDRAFPTKHCRCRRCYARTHLASRARAQSPTVPRIRTQSPPSPGSNFATYMPITLLRGISALHTDSVACLHSKVSRPVPCLDTDPSSNSFRPSPEARPAPKLPKPPPAALEACYPPKFHCNESSPSPPWENLDDGPALLLPRL